MGMWQTITLLLCLSESLSAYYRPAYGDPKIYTFALTGIEPGSKFNGNEVVGPRKELIKEVCCRASKRCDIALVDFERCYNENHLSEVLNGRWYDACVDMADVPRRRASYSFSNIPFFDVKNPLIITGADSNVTLEDLRNPRNDIKVAFLANKDVVSSEAMNNFLKEYFTSPENQVPIGLTGVASEKVAEILQLINDPCSGVDVGVVIDLIQPGTPFKLLGEVDMDQGKATLMVRKDDQYILDWWDFTLKRFMCSDDYQKFCDRLDQELGKNSRNCPDPSEVDCSECTFERRVEACGCR